jgi:hypothetical protein
MHLGVGDGLAQTLAAGNDHMTGERSVIRKKDMIPDDAVMSDM